MARASRKPSRKRSTEAKHGLKVPRQFVIFLALNACPGGYRVFRILRVSSSVIQPGKKSKRIARARP